MKQSITPSSVGVTNVQALADIVIGEATALKQTFDKTGLDEKTYINDVLIAELNGDNGSKKIGHDSANLTSDNVADALEELLVEAQQAQAGTIMDGAIPDVKLSNAVGQIKDRFANLRIVNVRDFGAVGDGVADDTTAIQDTIDYCSANSGVPAMPNGNYLVTSTLVLNVNCRSLIGENMLTTTITYQGAVGTYAIKTDYVDTEGVLSGGFTYGLLQGFNLVCPNTKDRGGLDFKRFRYGLIDRVIVQYASMGMDFDDSWGTKIKNSKLFFNNTGADFGSDANNIIFDNTEFNSNAIGAKLSGSGVGFTNGCTFELNTLCIEVGNLYHGYCKDSYFDNNDRIADWGTNGESLKLDFISCYYTSLAIDDFWHMETNSLNATKLSVIDCEFNTPTINVALVNHVTGSIGLNWIRNTFKAGSPSITNTTRYDRIKTDGAITHTLTLINSWTAVHADLTPKLTIDSEGYVNISGAIIGGAAAAFCNSIPTYLQPLQYTKFPACAGATTALGNYAEIEVRTTGEIRQYGGNSSTVWLSGRWKRG
jgi:hypothetical protein